MDQTLKGPIWGQLAASLNEECRRGISRVLDQRAQDVRDIKLAEAVECDDASLEEIARRGCSQAQQVMAARPDLSAALQVRLAKVARPLVWLALCQRRDLAQEAAAVLGKKKHPKVLIAVFDRLDDESQERVLRGILAQAVSDDLVKLLACRKWENLVEEVAPIGVRYRVAARAGDLRGQLRAILEAVEDGDQSLMRQIDGWVRSPGPKWLSELTAELRQSDRGRIGFVMPSDKSRRVVADRIARATKVIEKGWPNTDEKLGEAAGEMRSDFGVMAASVVLAPEIDYDWLRGIHEAHPLSVYTLTYLVRRDDAPDWVILACATISMRYQPANYMGDSRRGRLVLSKLGEWSDPYNFAWHIGNKARGSWKPSASDWFNYARPGARVADILGLIGGEYGAEMAGELGEMLCKGLGEEAEAWEIFGSLVSGFDGTLAECVASVGSVLGQTTS